MAVTLVCGSQQPPWPALLALGDESDCCAWQASVLRIVSWRPRSPLSPALCSVLNDYPKEIEKLVNYMLKVTRN